MINDAEATPAMDTTPTQTGHGTPRCDGKLKQRDGTCQRPAGAGTNHKGIGRCKLHGGSTPSHIAAAQKTIAEQAARTYGTPRDINPITAMVELLHDTAGAVAWLRDIIRDKDPDALVWGVADEVNKGSGEFPGVDTRHAAAPSVWLQRYDVERQLLLSVSRDLARLGLDWDAREAIRRQGAVLTRVCRGFAARMGHDPNSPAVIEAFRSSLREVLGAGADVNRVVEGRLV